MSDCSMAAMKPKKQQRTCGTCAHCEPCEWNCNVEENAQRWIVNIDDVDVPCKGLYYEDYPDSLPRRYKRLAHVALDMLRYARIRLGEHWTKEDAKACKAYEDELRALGVSVDD